MPRPKNTPERLWSLVSKATPNECWPWMGWRNEQGYGRFEIDGKTYYAHRAIYLLARPGSIRLNAPKRRTARGFLRHSCDNPPCCNPAHLIIGTHAENMHDKSKRGRSPRYSGDSGPNCKLTMEDAFWIRIHFKYGATRNALSLLYKVSVPAIKGVISGRTYRDT